MQAPLRGWPQRLARDGTSDCLHLHHSILGTQKEDKICQGVGPLGEGQKDWYDNKTLYEMLVEVSKRLEKTNAELEKTQIMIRDYNGLRERLNHCELALNEGQGKEQGKEQGSKAVWGYVIGAFGIASFLFSIVLHFVK